jgi:hypothetical protein
MACFAAAYAHRRLAGGLTAADLPAQMQVINGVQLSYRWRDEFPARRQSYCS